MLGSVQSTTAFKAFNCPNWLRYAVKHLCESVSVPFLHNHSTHQQVAALRYFWSRYGSEVSTKTQLVFSDTIHSAAVRNRI